MRKPQGSIIHTGHRTRHNQARLKPIRLKRNRSQNQTQPGKTQTHQTQAKPPFPGCDAGLCSVVFYRWGIRSLRRNSESNDLRCVIVTVHACRLM
eukprot:3899781-Amphidinium_carterae.1